MRYLAAKGEGGGKEVYVVVLVAKLRHQIQVVEVKPMERGLVTAQAIEKGLMEKGRVVLDGLFFDHDKATLTPESKPALDVVARYLAAHPDIKVFIVGHTDGTGTFDYNLNLSRERAQAVVAALAGDHGIAAARMSAHGVGPLSPVKANESDANRGENRRVEMVTQ
jgi:outer membrane protein OmpA-like peptidoglycan-associated protein